MRKRIPAGNILQHSDDDSEAEEVKELEDTKSVAQCLEQLLVWRLLSVLDAQLNKQYNFRKIRQDQNEPWEQNETSNETDEWNQDADEDEKRINGRTSESFRDEKWSKDHL